MAIHSGTSGSVLYATSSGTAGTLIGQLKSWSITVEAEELDTSAFGQSWRTFDAGVKQWGGSFQGNVDAADAQQIAIWSNLLTGTKAELALKLDATKTYYGTVVMISQDLEDSFDGLAESTWNFRGNSTLGTI